MAYFVYMVKCADGTLYTGTTNDVGKRVHAHNNSASAAKYTRGRRPVTLVYAENCKTKSRALKREHFLKGLTRPEKIKLFPARAVV